MERELCFVWRGSCAVMRQLCSDEHVEKELC